MADDVAGVIQALKLGAVHVAGNDFGNRVARMLAASHPELTRSVILLAAGGKIQPKPAALYALEVIFNPASTDAEVMAIMPYLVSNPAHYAASGRVSSHLVILERGLSKKRPQKLRRSTLGGHQQGRPSI
jgi:pimeloyl-ACP methyl ester carboxylesterase